MQENRQEKSPIKQKILLYLSKKGITEYEFYKKSGTTRGILTQNNGISEENLARFLAYAPEVNEEWLLTGRGDMLKTNSTPTDTPPDEPHSYNIKDKENPSDNQNNDPIFLAASPREGIPLIPFSAMARLPTCPYVRLILPMEQTLRS